MIDKRAEIHPKAKIADNVKIEPWSIIGEEVEIGENTWVGPHVIIEGPTKIGKNNKIYHFSSIGGDPQDLTYAGEKTSLIIGDHNIFREYCSINRGTGKGGSTTRIGSDNFFMACTHVGHDCIIGDHAIFTNYATLAGHVTIEDYVKIGPYSAIHQFCTIGAHSFVSRATYITKDVLPFLMIAGNSASVCGLNTVGLRREGFSSETIESLRRAYKVIFRKGLSAQQAIEELGAMVSECEHIQEFIRVLENSERGILR